MPETPERRPRLRFLIRPATAVSQASWLYPLKVYRGYYGSHVDGESILIFQGIYYFFTHPFLWPLLRARLLPSALLSLFVLTNLFIW